MESSWASSMGSSPTGPPTRRITSEESRSSMSKRGSEGGGIGRRLVGELCRFFASKNVEEVTLNYIIGNKEGEGFWKTLGFKPIRIGANVQFKELMERVRGQAIFETTSVDSI